jgi:GNAT superfamily N-acetyltransferase
VKTKAALDEIKEVASKADWNDFINLPWTIYKDDSTWVPPLKIAVRDLLNVNKNPFFKHACMRAWNAYRDGQCVGRIVGVVDDNHNEYHNEKTAFFGFFESINDQKIADALLGVVAEWARSKGMTTLRGPMNPSTNHECGLLVEGFDDTPYVMMTYNPKYYSKLLEKWGFKKAMDLFAYRLDSKNKFAERLTAQAERLKRRGSVTFRPVNMRDFEGEVERILEIYNDAWEKNWGFVPMDREEFFHMAKDLKMVLDPELLMIAEVKGQTAGFALALPDANLAIHKVKDGELLPTGILKLLWHLKGPARKKTVNRCRVITLGIKKAYQQYGIGPLFYNEYVTKCPKIGYKFGEASWILEDNVQMNKALEQMCGERHKVYRIYDRALV